MTKRGLIAAALFGLAALTVSDHLSLSTPSTWVGQAQAVVGRPLTPVSYAGVARRTTRRAVVATTPATRCVTSYNAYGQAVTVCN